MIEFGSFFIFHVQETQVEVLHVSLSFLDWLQKNLAEKPNDNANGIIFQTSIRQKKNNNNQGFLSINISIFNSY